MSLLQEVSSSLPLAEDDMRIVALRRVTHRYHVRNTIASAVLWIITSLVMLLFVSIILKLLIDGASSLVRISFYGTGPDGIAKELFNTFYILILTELLLFPISLAAAIYLIEYVPQGRLVTIIHFAAETLAGVPAIVLGMFGVLVFSGYADLGISRLAGALTLLCFNLPLGLRVCEDALVSVPRELREGALALGATRWQAIRTVVLPSALPGLVTGLILTAGRIISEAAPLLFTMGIFNPANVFTLDPTLASDTLTTRLYYLKGPGAGSSSLSYTQETALAAGIAAILILLLLLINIGARALSRVIYRKMTAE